MSRFYIQDVTEETLFMSVMKLKFNTQCPLGKLNCPFTLHSWQNQFQQQRVQLNVSSSYQSQRHGSILATFFRAENVTFMQVSVTFMHLQALAAHLMHPHIISVGLTVGCDFVKTDQN